MNSNSFECSVDLAIPQDAAWQLITNSKQIELWWIKDVVIELIVGGKFAEPWTDGTGKSQLASGTVLECYPEKKLRFSWKEQFWGKNEQTEVTIELNANSSGTRLSLTHSGWDSFNREKRNVFRNGFKSAWGEMLNKLGAISKP